MAEDVCLKCAFYNKDAKYGCDMTDDIPVICSVKMKKIKNDKRSIRNQKG